MLCHKDTLRSGGTALLSLDGGEWSYSRPGRFTPGNEPPVPTGWEAGWATEPVWTLWRREKFYTAGNRTRPVKPVVHRYTD
jgi:hypothetical protein